MLDTEKRFFRGPSGAILMGSGYDLEFITKHSFNELYVDTSTGTCSSGITRETSVGPADTMSIPSPVSGLAKFISYSSDNIYDRDDHSKLARWSRSGVGAYYPPPNEDKEHWGWSVMCQLYHSQADCSTWTKFGQLVLKEYEWVGDTRYTQFYFHTGETTISYGSQAGFFNFSHSYTGYSEDGISGGDVSFTVS